jgi:hypothetical protein
VNIEEIIAQIDEEISKLRQAKAVLGDVATAGVRPKVGRPKKGSIAARILSVEPVKRTMSAAGKAKIAEAQRKRWAKSKRLDKKAAHTSAVKAVANALGAKPVKRVRKTAVKKAVKSTPVKASTPTA